MSGHYPAQLYVPSCGGAGAQQRRGYNPVRHNPVADSKRFQAAPAHSHSGAARPRDIRAELLQEALKLAYLRLLCRVHYHRLALCGACGQHGVLRSSHARHRQCYPCAVQPVGRGAYELAPALVYLSSKGPESHQVEVYRPRTQLASSGHAELCAAAAGQQCAEEDNRASELPHEPVWNLAGGHGPRVYVHRIPFALDGAAEAAQYAYRRVNVAQLGDVQQLRLTRREYARRHYRQHGVLRALDGHAACEAVSALNVPNTHFLSPISRFMPYYAGKTDLVIVRARGFTLPSCLRQGLARCRRCGLSRRAGRALSSLRSCPRASPGGAAARSPGRAGCRR